MDWKKVKSILIIVFLIINILFFFYLRNLTNKETAISSQTINDIVSLLQGKNISVDSKKIPIKSGKMPVCHATKLTQNPDIFAKQILGESYSADELGNFWQGERKLKLQNDSFDYINPAPNEKSSVNMLSDTEGYCRDVLKEYDVPLQYAKFKGVNRVSDDRRKAIFAPVLGDYEFFDSYLTVEVSPGGILAGQGKNWLTSIEQVNEYHTVRPITGILTDFIQNPDINTEKPMVIIDIAQGYYLGSQSQDYKTVLPIPAWRIAANDGGIYYYDARNGAYISQ